METCRKRTRRGKEVEILKNPLLLCPSIQKGSSFKEITDAYSFPLTKKVIFKINQFYKKLLLKAQKRQHKLIKEKTGRESEIEF